MSYSHHYVPPPPAAEPPKPEKSKREWPLAVRQYVQRSFALENSIVGIEKDEMEKKLKLVIAEAAESNTLLTVDWESLPLPQQMIETERIKKGSTLISTPWTLTSSVPNAQDTNLSSNGKNKRKSIENDGQVPWRNTNTRNAFEDRVTYPDKRQRSDFGGKGSSKSHANLETRRNRFGDAALSPYALTPTMDTTPAPEVIQGPVVGRSEVLEKKYFRLTSAPNPDTVRPLHVLEKTLDLLKKKWRKENNYGYICDQFKSLRQDLTVQHIKNDFTVNVYEIHARIALEKGDLGEYNQCQTQLRALYSQKLGGHPTEFKAYRILYFIHTCNRTDMNDVLADLTATEKKEPAIKHALSARSALALGNYHQFFKLYLETPNMGAYLMDIFVSRERLAALTNMCKA